MELRAQLLESNSIIEAIREGSIDALVLNKDGRPQVYSIESADYTYRVLIEKFGEGALSISHDGLILYCNNHFSKMARKPSNEITGVYLSEFVESPERLNELLKESWADGPVKAEINLKIGDLLIPVYASFTDLAPTISAVGVIITDLSEKKRHEEDLLSYQKRLEAKIAELNTTNVNLEQFIHVISHDLKEPLRKILMYTSHLYESKAELFEAKERNNLNVINSSALRLDSLVDDLVKYSFVARKEVFRKVDIKKVVEEVVDDLELVISEGNAEISYGGLPTIIGSKVQLRQLFSNIISNALKYRKNDVKPIIEFQTEIVADIDVMDSSRRFYKISISDNGIGMDNKYIGRIFTIFQRLHQRNEYSGNGIGLAISKKIMDNHSGFITAESEPDAGSTFNLYFPV